MLVLSGAENKLRGYDLALKVSQLLADKRAKQSAPSAEEQKAAYSDSDNERANVIVRVHSGQNGEGVYLPDVLAKAVAHELKVAGVELRDEPVTDEQRDALVLMIDTTLSWPFDNVARRAGLRVTENKNDPRMRATLDATNEMLVAHQTWAVGDEVAYWSAMLDRPVRLQARCSLP